MREMDVPQSRKGLNLPRNVIKTQKMYGTLCSFFLKFMTPKQ